jgi:hypothetical protein
MTDWVDNPISKAAGHVRAIEVFFCTCPQSEERAQLAGQMLAKWRELEKKGEVKLIVLQPDQKNKRSFQKTRRVFADTEAEGEVYILADDDCEPPTIEGRLLCMPFAKVIMDMYGETVNPVIGEAPQTCQHPGPKFGMLSAWPDPATIGTWTPEDYEVYEDAHVKEFHDVGGLRICRKGLLTDWPEQTEKGYDREHCAALRAIGWRVGYLKNIRTFHHGEGKSDLWPISLAVQ